MREYWYSGESTDTLYLFLAYVETYFLSWGGQHHSDSWENSLLSLLENNCRNKVFLDWTGVIIRTNAIGGLLQQCADYYFGVPARKLFLRRTSTLLSWHYWLTSTPVRIIAVCYYEGINTLIITLAYQYACFYSGIPLKKQTWTNPKKNCYSTINLLLVQFKLSIVSFLYVC
jgi:hypothetical protein